MTDAEHAALDRIMLNSYVRRADWRTLRDAVAERDGLQARVAALRAELMTERRLSGTVAQWLEGSTGAKVQIVTIGET
jgi:hypothetical protein